MRKVETKIQNMDTVTFYWTGHPFVDAGLAAILLIAGKNKPEELNEKDIERAIDFASKLYATKKWSSSFLHGMMMPNNGIILANPGTVGPISAAIKNAIKQEKSLRFSESTKKDLTERISKNFDSLLADEILKFLKPVSENLSNVQTTNIEKFAEKVVKVVLSQPFVTEAIQRKIKNNLLNLFRDASKSNSLDKPSCIICGKRRAYAKKEVYRAIVPLLGSGDVLNYFHSANPHGADICAHCIFLIQFMPLVSYRLPRVLVIHAYPYELMLELSKEALADVRKNRLASRAKDFKRPENFLFHLVGEITRKIERDEFWENASVTLYYFICNNQKQILDVIHIPTQVLRFVAYANLVDQMGWKRIVSMGWKELPDVINFEKLEREKRRNRIYSRLLNNESILPYFYNPKERKVNAKWNLLAFYCKEVLGLEKESLEFIRDIGDRIVETLEKLPTNKMRRRVREIETAEKNINQFAEFFIRLEKDRQELPLKTPLMSFDEFARILTAYGEDLNISWRIVKDLLLFRIYEKLHDKLIEIEKEEEEIEESIE